MSLVEHLGELRKRIIWALVVFVIAMLIGLSISGPVIEYLMAGVAKDASLNALSPWDGIRTYMQFAFVIGLIISLPFVLYQLWAFVKPGLREAEQRVTLLYIPAAVLLYLTGLAFAYFVVFPMALFFTHLMTEQLELTQTYGITQYFSFMFNILLPISLLFELPIVVLFLTKLRILNPMRLNRMRRYAYVILLIVGAIVTPPDVVSAVIVTIPLIILYEISSLISRAVYRKQVQKDKQWAAEYGEK